MLRILNFLAVFAFAFPAFAQAPPAAEHRRVTWEEHFAQANLAHDGHLTLEEAKGGFAPVAKHFSEIDVDGKGYVTANDVRAWRVMRKAAHRLAQPPEDALKPRPAMQHGAVTAKPFRTSTTETVAGN